MITKLTRNGYGIDLKTIDKKLLNSIKEELTVKPKESDYTDGVKSFPVYTESKEFIYVPRYYGIEKFGNPTKRFLTSNKTKFKFTGQLRDYQHEIVNTCLNKIKTQGGGMLSVPCGYGKTTMALKIASVLGLKTLVLVHKTFLQDQWIERIKQFTNATTGLIRQDTVTSGNIVVGMVQSITSTTRDYDPAVFAEFDFLIIDEAHRYGSRVFSKALHKIGARHTLSLSATPDRLDGLTKVIHWFAGDVLFSIKAKPNKHVVTKVFKYFSNDPLFKEEWQWVKKTLKVSNTKMINNLVKIVERNNHVINIINTIRKNPERKILILSGRRDHLTLLKNAVDKAIANDIHNKILIDGECITTFYIGGMKEQERRRAEQTGDILFGTYSMAEEGLDIDRLNTIILATPKNNVVQAIGRIMRKILGDGDVKPLIVDISDDLSIYKRQSEVRINEYFKNRHQIETSYLHNSQILSCESYMKNVCKFADSHIREYIDDAENNVYTYDLNYTSIFDIDKINIDNDGGHVKEECIKEFVPYEKTKKDYTKYMFD